MSGHGARKFENSIFLNSLSEDLRRKFLRAAREGHAELLGPEKELVAVQFLFADTSQSEQQTEATPTARRKKDIFGTDYSVVLCEYRIATTCGIQTTAGHLLVTKEDGNEALIPLTISRYLCMRVLVNRSERFKGRGTAGPTRPSYRCYKPQIEIAFSDYADAHPHLRPYLKNKIKFSNDIYHLKKALRDAGVGDLIKGTLGTGLYLDTAPENVSFQPAA